MGAGGPSGGSGTGPQELGYTTRDKRTDKQKQKDANVELGLGSDRISNLSMDNTGKGGEGTKILISPTVSEVSQSNAANATTPVEEDPLYLRKKKTLRLKLSILTFKTLSITVSLKQHLKYLTSISLS